MPEPAHDSWAVRLNTSAGAHLGRQAHEVEFVPPHSCDRLHWFECATAQGGPNLHGEFVDMECEGEDRNEERVVWEGWSRVGVWGVYGGNQMMNCIG